MNFLKNALNVLFGIGVMVFGMLSVISLVSILGQGGISAEEILLSNAGLIVLLFIAYLINKPRDTNEVVVFYNTKWFVGLVTITMIVVIGIAAYLLKFEGLLSMPLLPSRNSGFISVGVVLLMALFLLGLLNLAYRFWRCPKCKNSLPFLQEGKSMNIGFSINKCPSCKVVLSNA
jgi:hypothetical protein